MASPLRYGFLFSVFALILSAVPQSSHAALGALDDMPGSTLLFPYFEVDLNNANGLDTVLTVQNTSASAALAHTVLWTDEGVPAAVFDVYLTGYDIAAISMRDVLNGNLPVTASDGQDPTDTISPQGAISQDLNFASCNGQLPIPAGTIPAPAGMTPADLRRALTGTATSGIAAGSCWGHAYNDNHARGYVTVDTVNGCTTLVPNDPAYYAPATTPLNYSQNVLIGSFQLVDRASRFWFSDHAVALEGDYDDAPVSGSYTFYGRYNGWNASDRREPLPTNWVLQGEKNTSSLIVWRDTKTNSQPHTCGSNPSYYPLGQEGFSFFSMDSEANPLLPTAAVPLATQVVPVSSITTPTPAGKLGILFADLNTTVAAPGSGPASDPSAAQSYVAVIRSRLGEGPITVGHRATPLDGSQAAHFVPVPPPPAN